jgi:hypothetical protein
MAHDDGQRAQAVRRHVQRDPVPPEVLAQFERRERRFSTQSGSTIDAHAPVVGGLNRETLLVALVLLVIAVFGGS